MMGCNKRYGRSDKREDYYKTRFFSNQLMKYSQERFSEKLSLDHKRFLKENRGFIINPLSNAVNLKSIGRPATATGHASINNEQSHVERYNKQGFNEIRSSSFKKAPSGCISCNNSFSLFEILEQQTAFDNWNRLSREHQHLVAKMKPISTKSCFDHEPFYPFTLSVDIFNKKTALKKNDCDQTFYSNLQHVSSNSPSPKVRTHRQCRSAQMQNSSRNFSLKSRNVSSSRQLTESAAAHVNVSGNELSLLNQSLQPFLPNHGKITAKGCINNQSKLGQTLNTTVESSCKKVDFTTDLKFDQPVHKHPPSSSEEDGRTKTSLRGILKNSVCGINVVQINQSEASRTTVTLASNNSDSNVSVMKKNIYWHEVHYSDGSSAQFTETGELIQQRDCIAQAEDQQPAFDHSAQPNKKGKKSSRNKSKSKGKTCRKENVEQTEEICHKQNDLPPHPKHVTKSSKLLYSIPCTLQYLFLKSNLLDSDNDKKTRVVAWKEDQITSGNSISNSCSVTHNGSIRNTEEKQEC